MRTIFIPISERQQARNVLRTDILNKLQEDFNTRIVIFAPSARIPQYKKECSARSTIFESTDIPRKPTEKIDIFFHRLSLFYINTGTARFLRKQGLYYDKKEPVRYALSLGFLFIIGNRKILHTIFRFFDLHLVRDERLAKLFDTYKPDLVFAPKITSSIDRSFLRHAKIRGVKTVGMISTFDNITLSKYPFRILPDSLVAYNQTIKNEAIKYLGMSADSIVVTGMPHYDFYITEKRSTREEFCARLGIDPARRIILFSSVGNIANPTEWQALSMLVEAFKENRLPKDLVIIFRQHPTEKAEIQNIPKNKNVVVDDSKTIFPKGTNTFSEILSKDMLHLADSVYHASILVTTTSSMSIDASVFDTPVINIAFDGHEQLPFHLSVRRKLTKHHTHYQPIVNSGGVRIVRSEEDLISAIQQYLKDPTLDQEGRKQIVKEQCYKLDGKAGERISTFLLSLMKQSRIGT